MTRKLIHNTLTAAGIAALLMTGACAHNNAADNNDLVEVRPEMAGQSADVAPAPGPAKIDSDGNIYSSSAAPGKGNPSNVGTNTNVNIVPNRSTATVTSEPMTTSATLDTTTPVEPAPVYTPSTTTETTTVQTTPAPVYTPSTTTETTVPMTSSVQEDTTTTTTTTTTETPTRQRLRKD